MISDDTRCPDESRIPDETLNYWGDVFVAAGLAELLSFEEFMRLAPPLRERRLNHLDLARHARKRVAPLPDAALHGDRLIDPMHHGLRPYRQQPLYFRRRRHV